MSKPTISGQLRLTQDRLNIINHDLAATLALAHQIGLAPFRIAAIQAAMNDNQHAWNELNAVATSLELTHADRKL